jgi:S-adenosylmethionine hydrolase
LKSISLLTDFGLKDGYPGVMKGVILSIAPDAQIADLTHLIPAQNVLEGSLVLARSFPYFPAGSVHIAVVDPGVGTQRRPIAARLGEHYFVLPDNGLITHSFQLAQKSGWDWQFVHLQNRDYWLPQVSNVFHGRDIFSPTGAYLAQGVPLTDLGPVIDDPVLLTVQPPERTAEGWRARIVVVDHFGNLMTNLEEDRFNPQDVLEVRCGSAVTRGMVATFGEAQVGDVVALIDSDGQLSVCVVNGNAAEQLNVGPGDPVEVILHPHVRG